MPLAWYIGKGAERREKSIPNACSVSAVSSSRTTIAVGGLHLLPFESALAARLLPNGQGMRLDLNLTGASPLKGEWKSSRLTDSEKACFSAGLFYVRCRSRYSHICLAKR